MRQFLVVLPCILSLAVCGQKPFEEVKKTAQRKMKTLDSTGWERGGIFLLNVNQGALGNWVSGGENFMIGINQLIDYAIHHRRGKYSFDSYFDMELGVVEASSFGAFRKTADRFDLTLEMEHTMAGRLNYGLLVNANSQMFPGYDYSNGGHTRVSSFLSPGKFLLAPGIDKKIHNAQMYFSIFVSPAAARWITKADDHFFRQAKFGVDSGRHVNREFGAFLSSHYNIYIGSFTKYIGRVDLFTKYSGSIENTDILITNLLNISISRKFSANILLDIIYDDDITPHTQFREIFGLGLSLSL